MRFAEFPSHFRLMLLTARTQPTAAEQDSIAALLQTEVDWAGLVAVTTSHRLIPLVLAGLEAHAIPPEVRQTLLQAKKDNDLRVLRSTLETCRITDRFAAEGVDLVTLKGRGLAQTIYADARLRHAGDLDLLSLQAQSPHEIARHIELLQELGYKLINPTAPLTPRRLQSYHRFWKDLTFRHVASGRPLDLHWRLFNNRHHAGNRLLEDLHPATVEVLGTPVRTLPPHDQFLHLALHGVADEWVYFKGLADVAAYLRRIAPDEFQTLLQRASDLGLLPQISSAVHLAREFFGVRSAHPMLCLRTHPLHVRLRRRLLDRLERANFQPARNRLGALDAVRFELLLVPNSLAEIVLRFLYRPRVWTLVSLPDRLFNLYPILGLLLPPRRAPGRRALGGGHEAQ